MVESTKPEDHDPELAPEEEKKAETTEEKRKWILPSPFHLRCKVGLVTEFIFTPRNYISWKIAKRKRARLVPYVPKEGEEIEKPAEQSR